MTTDSYINRFFQWSTVAALYSLCFFIRTSPNTLQSVLQSQFHLSYGDLGILSATFYYAYGSCQLLGAIFSRQIGLHRIFMISLIFLLLGLGLFSTAESIFSAIAGRVFMGMGSSLVFIYTLSLARSLFAPRDYPLYVGMTNFLGMIGALCAQTPLESFIQHYNWQWVFSGIFVIIILFLPILSLQKQYFFEDTNPLHHNILLKNDWNLIRATLQNFLYWILIAFSMIAPLLVIPEMWGSLFLEEVYHYTSFESSKILSAFFVGVASGSLTHGYLSRKLCTHNIISVLILGEAIGVFLFIFPTLTSLYLMIFCALLIGFCASGMLLFFTLINNEYKDNSLSTPLFNMSIMIFSSFLQPLIGWILDYFIMYMTLKEALILSLSFLPILLLIIFISLRFRSLSYN